MICKGSVIDLIPVTETVMQVVIRVKKGDAYTCPPFTAYQENKILIQQIKIEKGDYVKIEYHLTGKKWQDKYFLTAVIEKIKIVAKKSPQQLIVDLSTGEIIG
jgi:hypothetical protein